jgi:hypothetical protein
MKNNHKNLAPCLMILSFLLLGCSAGSQIAGHVYDSNNVPVANATVKFEQVGNFGGDTSHQCIQQSWTDGKFGCGFLHAAFFSAPLKLTISKDGYKTYQLDLTSDEVQKKTRDKEEYSVVLEKE